MDLKVKDSKIIRSIVHDSFYKILGNESEDILSAFNIDETNTNNLVNVINDISNRLGLRSEIKRKLLDKIADSMSDYIQVSISPNTVELVGSNEFIVNVTVKNSFDVPFIFNVYLEDRDNFLDVIYDRVNNTYVNTYSIESVIDTGDQHNFKFKLANTRKYSQKSSTLFVIIRSVEVDILNVINKLPLHID